jgi:uncharacterized damage-inducible protein DinB
MNEKDVFLEATEREFQTTMKLLKEYPAGKEDWKPAEKSRSGRDLVWIMTMEEQVVTMALEDKLSAATGPPPTPQVPVSELIEMYKKSHAEVVQKIRNAPADAFDKTSKFPVGPGKIVEWRIGQIAWFMLNDSIHHRGQFSVYLRMLGAKVPAMYGPSLDEPWK